VRKSGRSEIFFIFFPLRHRSFFFIFFLLGGVALVGGVGPEGRRLARVDFPGAVFLTPLP